MNNSPKILLVGVAVAAAVCGVFFFMAGGPQNSVGKRAQTAPGKSPAPLETPRLSGPTNPTGVGEAQPLLALVERPSVPKVETKPQIFEAIHDAAVSYDAKELPKIQPYLLHPDPEIRAAALQGMIDLGDAAAGPLLRAAAPLAPSPAEAKNLREAADFVELPSASLINRPEK
ncbi:hypothetical protein GCM10023213_42350 [Prosthecobacter algae]|uniref:HEAT repeat domain-containing protein n=1 Tax=Prosthecobacter algae TaxID=1144682 RepID=A0ABP9PP77_9BACT